MKNKKQNIQSYLENLENHDELFKKWADLYELEEDILNSIVEARKAKGISQKQLAEMTNLKQPAIARIEKGVNSPQLNTLIKIADALGLKINMQEKNHMQETYDLSFYEETMHEIFTEKMKIKLIDKAQYIFDRKGEYTYENTEFQDTCDKNYPA